VIRIAIYFSLAGQEVVKYSRPFNRANWWPSGSCDWSRCLHVTGY